MFLKVKLYVLFVFLFSAHLIQSVEVHFEAADSGFFLKHSRQPPVAPEISNVPSSAVPPTAIRKNYDAILSVDRFTVVQTTQPVSIRASYGPFSTKQTVPARYIVPDAIDNKNEYLNNTTAALMELQQSNMHLDISAHLVRPSVSQDSPVLRVLFHAGADPRGHLQRQKICVLLHVSIGSMLPLKGRCMPEGEDGVCVAEVVIPSNWWPAIPPPLKEWKSGASFKSPQKFVQVSYSVFEPPLRNPEQCEPKIQIQPLTTFAQVPLISATTSFREIRADDTLTILIPQYPLYPLSKIHVPVFLHQVGENRISAFTMKARVKNGIRILGATASSDLWNISTEKENQKHTTARVTAFKTESENSEEKSMYSEQSRNISSVEVFSWLLEVAEDTLEGGKIVWSVQYVFDNVNAKDKSQVSVAIDESKRKLVAKLEVNKDDIQAVLPMAKNWELMNTAVLTGRQVAQAMKVFIVSQAGKVADVTLQSSCHAEDESVIKVSSSCSSVYVDGSEIRGSSNASVIVKYGTYIGVAKFVVWMPEFPLEVYISDFRLSQIKGWKVMDENFHKQSRRRKKRSYVWGQHGTNYYNNNAGSDRMTCRARYQQSPVEVYARFLAIDQNSGRISYFISRRTGLCVTDLVQPLLRVADPKIASLKGRILQGKSMGRTDVQVLSPITGRVIGAKEVRVGSDKVSISKLIVNVVSGLQLTITPDNTIENGYISETSVTHKLTAQYQEGLLDIDLEFSDGSKTPLRDVAVEDYFLLVESLDTEVVAFAPMLASHHPRVIAVGEGNGNLLRVTLLLSEDCRARRNPISTKQGKLHNMPLASALANVEVDFDNVDNINKQDVVQNDGIIGRERKPYRNNGDLADIIVGTPMRDASHNLEPTIQARQHRSGIHFVDSLFRHGKKGISHEMSSMEIGMYVLLTAFCFAIIVFVISCVVYASKFRPIAMEGSADQLDAFKRNMNGNVLLHDIRLPKEPTTNAHDWVWLGRSTLDRSSVVSNAPRDHCDNGRDWRIRITSNPFMNYNNSQNIQNLQPDGSFGINKAQNESLGEQQSEQSNDSNNIRPEYRPPVPPHRNVGVCANVDNGCKDLPPRFDHKHFHRRNKSVGRVSTHLKRTQEEIETPELNYNSPVGQLQGLQPSPEQVFSPQEITSLVPAEKNNSKEMHNAEKLIERMNHHQRNAFQFDSLTPKKKPEITEAGHHEVKEQAKAQSTPSTGSKSENDPKDGMVIASNDGAVSSRKSRVKRATVVGNPMFSTSEDDGKGGESLGLDDLDMDYEQIMDYFHNLKESNA